MPDHHASAAVTATLRHAEKNEQYHRVALIAAAGLEAALIGTFLVVADLTNRTHVLLLMTFAGWLSLFALASVVLATFLNRHTLRVLRAVELVHSELRGS